ncbi:MAG: hypothetical protein KDD11_19640, partial [Acidobacteria bacterium]|nr:hypothetical protein [Acidobacteriota bacterium]
MEIRRAVTGITSLGLALATLAAVQGRAGGKVAPNVPAAGPVLEARFVNGRPTDRVIVPMEGWPLTLTLRAKEGSLMGLESGIFPFPRTGQTGSLVFSVSGSAPAEGDGGSGGTRKGSAPAPVRLDFEPGWNLPEAGARPTDGAPPRLWTMGLGDGFEPAPELAVVGPPLGSSKDGYGYGPNPLLPGLVLLADAGPGVVTDERFERPSPRRARNLAGFFQSLGYELRDARGATTLTA